MTKIEAMTASSLLPASGSTKKLFFKIGGNLKGIFPKNISLFYAEGKATYALVDNRRLPTTVTLKVIEGMLSPDFIRCHRKYVVNIDFINIVNLKEQKLCVDGQVIPIGYAYRKTFVEGLTILK